MTDQEMITLSICNHGEIVAEEKVQSINGFLAPALSVLTADGITIQTITFGARTLGISITNYDQDLYLLYDEWGYYWLSGSIKTTVANGKVMSYKLLGEGWVKWAVFNAKKD